MDPFAIGALVIGLLTNYGQSGTPASEVPSGPTIQQSLLKLLQLGKLSKADFKEDAITATLTKIEGVITSFRQDNGLAPGDKILNDVVRSLDVGCLSRPGFTTGRVSTRAIAAADKNVVKYVMNSFFYWAPDDAFPMVKKSGEDQTLNFARAAFREAWLSWQLEFDINPKDITNATKPDGSPYSLNDAMLRVETTPNLRPDYRAYTSLVDAGHGGQVSGGLLMQINANYEWGYDDFRGTICHEIGHLLGIGHNEGDASTLMHDVYEGVNEPQDWDLVAAIKKGWTPNPTSRAETLADQS
ncbi:MAG: hypothetical protein HQ518_04115 [Rhodopirellula sp.]|nr:hypothetical protein [Rhodopirellula sp.]